MDRVKGSDAKIFTCVADQEVFQGMMTSTNDWINQHERMGTFTERLKHLQGQVDLFRASFSKLLAICDRDRGFKTVVTEALWKWFADVWREGQGMHDVDTMIEDSLKFAIHRSSKAL